MENQSIQKYTDLLVRNYEITVSSKKKEVLSTIFDKIEETEVAQPKKGRKISLISFATISAAASVAVILAFYFFTASITIIGESDNKVCLLPDNSRIVLDSNSEIEYKKFNWNRKVKLEGVAYFEVEKGSNFQVKTNLGTVEVLGTRFLVSGSKDKMEVQCYEGSVRASLNAESAVLEAGNKFTGTQNGVKTEDFDTNIEYPELAKFNAQFSKESVVDIAKKLEVFFGTKITVEDSSNRIFSGTIQTAKLESALAIICGSMQLDYSVNEKNEIIIKNQN